MKDHRVRLGVIGYGAIAQSLIGLLPASLVKDALILTRGGKSISGATGSVAVRGVSSLEDLMASKPDLVVECAGHSAVQDCAEPLLKAGINFLPASLGAFADAGLLARVSEAAKQGGARMICPSGAIAGIDLLEALSVAGEVDVAYTGTKPPAAWVGTVAEARVDLARLSGPAEFFSGSAREAAQLFPKSTNVVAALALAGPGFDRVSVTLIADPSAEGNRHSYEVASPSCRATFSIESRATSKNARTSLTTVYSLMREITVFAGYCGLNTGTLP